MLRETRNHRARYKSKAKKRETTRICNTCQRIQANLPSIFLVSSSSIGLDDNDKELTKKERQILFIANEHRLQMENESHDNDVLVVSPVDYYTCHQSCICLFCTRVLVFGRSLVMRSSFSSCIRGLFWIRRRSLSESLQEKLDYPVFPSDHPTYQ